MYKAIRYIGSKQKLLNFLDDNLISKLKENDSFYDGFVGTGIVSQFVSENYKNIKISGSDISLYSGNLLSILNKNIVFVENELENILVEFFNSKKEDKGIIYNEFSNLGTPLTLKESRNFFDSKTAIYIDSFRNFIFNKLENKLITKEQCDVLLFFILAYTCKNANTTSIFGSFLKGKAKHLPFNLDFCLKIIKETNSFQNIEKVEFYNLDIENTLKEINQKKIIYLDPPYTTRRYENNYHILNYIVDKDFNENYIKMNSKGGISEMKENPFGSKKETFKIFEKMILLGVEKSELLAISYNTDGIIKQNWMESFCESNGLKLETKTLDYKRYTSHDNKANKTNLVEILWLISK